MYNKLTTILFSIITILLLASSCNNSGAAAAEEDIVFGIHFGMERDAFFKHCWDLNQEGKTGHGTVDNNVMYEDSINFDPKVVVNFYPDFVEDKIATMPMSFYYKGWAPWNKKDLSQEKLVQQLIKWFELKYGVGFKEKKVGNGDTAYYKVMGPVTVRVYKDPFDEMMVRADVKHSGLMKAK